MKTEFGEIEPCDCGGVNLSIGPMTLHFAADEYIALVELIEAGIEMVKEPVQYSDNDELETLN